MLQKFPRLLSKISRFFPKHFAKKYQVASKIPDIGDYDWENAFETFDKNWQFIFLHSLFETADKAT